MSPEPKPLPKYDPCNGAPEYCTCLHCEVVHRAIPLGRERARALADWITNGPEADAPARERVREIIGL